MKNMKELIYNSLAESKAVLDRFVSWETAALIDEVATAMAETLQAGGKIISCGNGGSLCDASHFAEELTGRYRNNRRPYPAIAINDAAYLTCVGNDYSFEEIFSRQVEALGNPGDILLAISTSGNSGNVVQAAASAKQRGMRVVALTQVGENRLAALADYVLASPSATYSDRIQEIHIKVIHTLIQAIESKLGHT